ncbi:MAG: acetyl-CoA carboxylase, carboxyltransferase subunit beta [Campylobacterales bacterium]|nr:acetyl-CoA carboxylase, carboxyltransferase subunit beta [Campylobacterales bacterium]
MIFEDILNKLKTQRPTPEEAPSQWVKCKKCKATMYYKEVALKKYVCPKCGLHMRIKAEERINLIADRDTFVEKDSTLKPTDPLEFKDQKTYKEKIELANKKTGKLSSVISGSCRVDGIETELVVFDFSFMGGSLGSVEGEKIVRAIDRAIENRNPLIIVSASGGARMQESTFSLMQMAKTSAALKKLDGAKLPFISLLTDPTFGGVSASFAMLGDIIIAEPGAMIGFAGARVIKQTIGADLPEGFQSAEFLLEKGLIDMVVGRDELKGTLSGIMRTFHGHEIVFTEDYLQQ